MPRDLGGLLDLPESGKPIRVWRETMDEIIERASRGKCTPKELRELVRAEAGIRLHITSIRRIMRGYGLTYKAPLEVHVNRANRKAVRNWQYRFDKRISCLEEAGFAIVVEDEAFFVHDAVSDRKHWSPRGELIIVPYTGSHKRIVVYGASPRTAGSFSGRMSGLTRTPSPRTSGRCRGISERWR